MGRIQFVMLARVTWAETKQDIGLTNHADITNPKVPPRNGIDRESKHS